MVNAVQTSVQGTSRSTTDMTLQCANHDMRSEYVAQIPTMAGRCLSLSLRSNAFGFLRSGRLRSCRFAYFVPMREFSSVVEMPGIRHALMCLVGQIVVKSTSVLPQCKRKNQNARDKWSETVFRRRRVSRSVADAWVRAIHLVATNFQCPRFFLEACMIPRHSQ